MTTPDMVCPECGDEMFIYPSAWLPQGWGMCGSCGFVRQRTGNQEGTVEPKKSINDPEQYDQLDISTEKWRQYHFPDKTVVQVDNPAILYIRRGQKPAPYGGLAHRVVDADGVGYYIPRGWLLLVWETKPGEPPITF